MPEKAMRYNHIAFIFNDLFECWDDDIKELWLKVYRAYGLTEESLINMNNLANEILLCCV